MSESPESPAASEPSLIELLATHVEPSATGPASPTGATLLAHVEDTHHPELPGRVFVRWADPDGYPRRRWLRCAQVGAPRIGEQVLLTRPANDSEYFVLARLGPAAPEQREPAPEADAAQLRLEPGRALQIVDGEGRPVLEIGGDAHGAVLRPLGPNLELDVRGCLRMSADRLELRARGGGVDVRTPSDAIVRGRTIRLN